MKLKIRPEPPTPNPKSPGLAPWLLQYATAFRRPFALRLPALSSAMSVPVGAAHPRDPPDDSQKSVQPEGVLLDVVAVPIDVKPPFVSLGLIEFDLLGEHKAVALNVAVRNQSARERATDEREHRLPHAVPSAVSGTRRRLGHEACRCVCLQRGC